MVEGLIRFTAEKGLFRRDEKILLAISGGMDSMVMMDLFLKAGFRFGIAHCNFSLRGKESEEDAGFVSKFAEKNNVPCFIRQFDTEKVAAEKGISIQMAARDLRYYWFEEIRKENGYAFTATAHHLDDQVETFFINLIRGTGIAGLHGILPKNGRLIRPMLFTFRHEIETYAFENKIGYREDSSNQSLKYTRNLIRHQLIPVLKSIQPEAVKSVTETIEKIRDFEIIGLDAIQLTREKVLKDKQGKIRIEIEELKKLRPLRSYAFELLSGFGFNYRVVDNILETLDSGSGKIFYSPTHRLMKDRKHLLIDLLLNEESILKNKPFLTMRQEWVGKDFILPADRDVACLDIKKLSLPLTMRRWQAGDSFFPLGMNKKKKLSDYFSDEKYTLTEKENTWLLISGDKIVWVVGKRIDNRFRVTSHTKEILYVMLIA